MKFNETFSLAGYDPHEGQLAFHWAMTVYDYVALICGIRGGKTYAGAREALAQAWNAQGRGVFGIIAPTYAMLDRTTWQEFREAAAPLILKGNDTKKIITLKNGRKVHGHSAEDPDRVRNETFCGFWGDEMREWKNPAKMWDVLQGRVLSTGGKGFITTSPNSFDDIHKIFIEEKKKNYGVIRFTTHENIHIPTGRIDDLASRYDSKFAQQEIYGEFVIFAGAVYYAFNRQHNAGEYAFKVAQYDPAKPLNLCCDFNVNPMAWVLTQYGFNAQGLREVYAVDEIWIRNSNTVQCCQEFKNRYPNHTAGINLYGDATGKNRSTASNLTNWKIIEEELAAYGVSKHVPLANPAERDRVNAVNGLICNSKGERRFFANPKKCPKLVSDLEQVAFKDGTTQIDDKKNLDLTHPSDAVGYQIEKEFSLNRWKTEGLKI